MWTIEKMLTMTHLDGSLQNKRRAMLGLALNLLAEQPAIASHSLDWHYQRLDRAIELRQLTFYFDRFGRNCGYVLWTRVPSELEGDLLKHGPSVLSAHQFSDKGAVWILDFRARFGELPNIIAELLNTLPSDCDTLTYFRYKRGRRIVKQTCWRDKDLVSKNTSRKCLVDEAEWLQGDQGGSLLSSAKAGLEISTHCGLILELFARLPRYACMPLSVVLGRIRYALGTKQYFLLRSQDDAPLAFYSWLWRESSDLTSSVPLHELELSEWRDGRDALLGDAVAAREGIDALRNELFAFAQGLWSVYPEHQTQMRPLMSSRILLSLAMPDTDVCDFIAAGATHDEKVSACEI
jgi:hemolysin-activating ACP:hemolysin acyltransferase